MSCNKLMEQAELLLYDSKYKGWSNQEFKLLLRKLEELQ